MGARLRTAAAALVLLAGATAAMALETDQFWAWGRTLTDSTDVLNAEVNAEIESVLFRVNARSH